MSHEIRSFEYVNHPYERVRAVLSGDVLSLFQSATKSASERAKSVASELRVNVGGLEVGTGISISVTGVEERSKEVTSPPSMKLDLEWEASTAPRLFPFMKAELSVFPLTATETQLALVGHYDPPLGFFGDAVNTVVGRRVAEASVHRFVKDVAEHLKSSLS